MARKRNGHAGIKNCHKQCGLRKDIADSKYVLWLIHTPPQAASKVEGQVAAATLETVRVAAALTPKVAAATLETVRLAAALTPKVVTALTAHHHQRSRRETKK